MTQPPGAGDRRADLEAVYREYHGFVWRMLHHLGLRGAGIDDAVQEVFVVVHRRLGSFDGRTSIKNWLYGITRRVASDHRKQGRRRAAWLRLVPSPEADRASGEVPLVEHASAAELVAQLLDALDEDKRLVLVMAELEGMTAPEIAEAIGANLNTVYSRLRAARQQFHREAQRHRVREDRRSAWRR
jgi:RNA polymerase sigma-70 factor (ECF subfamily)